MRIEKLNSDYIDEVMNFISEEPEYNIFIIGDIENYGFKEDFQTVWGGFDDSGELAGILLRYFESFIVYSYNEELLKKFSCLISKRGKMVSGKKEIIDLLKNYLSEEKIEKERNEYFAS